MMGAMVEKKIVAPDLVRGPSLHPVAVTKIRPRTKSGATVEMQKVTQ